MASRRWRIDWDDIMSTVRHTVVPFAAGVGVAALEAVQAGAMTPEAIAKAAITAAVAGGIRLLGKFAQG